MLATEKYTGGLWRALTSRVVRTWNAPASAHPLKPLLPLLSFTTRIYGLGLRRDQGRAISRRRVLPAFVISVGNLVVGGTGKTPFTLWLARRLSERGRSTAVLSRGYGRRGNEVARVPASGDTRSQVALLGDEPVLAARSLPRVPIWVGRNRFLSGQAAIETSGAEILILDDGFQHLALHRDLDLVLLSSDNPFGNGLLLPLGPLREPAENLARADGLVLTRAVNKEQTERTRRRLQELFPGKPVFSARHRIAGFRIGIDGPAVAQGAMEGRSAVAFAGVAQPESFFGSLRELGLGLSRTISFPDHHFYRASDISFILESVRESDARFLVTTQKDLVRLPVPFQEIVLGAELNVDFGSEEAAFCTYLESRLRAFALRCGCPQGEGD